MKSVNIENIKGKSKFNYKLFLLFFFLAMFATLSYLYVTQKELAVSAAGFILSGKKNRVIYETFDIYIEDLGEEYTSNIKENLLEVRLNDKERFNFVKEKEKADIVLNFTKGKEVVFKEFLLPVGHLYWVKDSITTTQLEQGEYKIIVNEDTYSIVSSFFKNNYPDLDIEKSQDLLEDLKDPSCDCIGLLKASELSKEYKLLKLDKGYYLDTFDAGIELSITAHTQSDDVNGAFVGNIIRKNIGLSENSFEGESVAKVNMTGVTALARRVARAMDSKQEYDYPAKKIAGFLSDADLTHTSNEVSFVNGCKSYTGMRFCSPPQSIETLKAIGVNVVELTGNHNNDFGSSYNTKTIEKYREEDMAYFGGGLDSTDARKPYITEVNGNEIAFLGYNYYDAVVAGGTNALAGVNKAGANPYSQKNLKEDIEKLEGEVDIIIVDFQYQECYSYPPSDVIYPQCYKPIGRQSSVFREAIDYGADIVVGTQAHQPQTYELYKEGVIFYGLGNLFFDQSMWIGTRQGLILTHYFKDGELIQTKITPTIYDSSLQVEVAPEDDAKLLLELLDTARSSL